MNRRLLRTLVTLIVSLAFVMNASAMMAAHAKVSGTVAVVSDDVLPCHKAAMPDIVKAHSTKPDTPKTDTSHDCCKKSPSGKATCASDCCTSVVPYRFGVFRAVSFIGHRHKIARLLPLHDRICDPPSKPPSV